jgi:hypothetical protein
MGEREGDDNDLEVIMTMIRFALVMSLFLAGACVDGGDDAPVDPPQDAASDVGPTDTAVTPEDTATPPEDTATPPEDTTTPPEDTATPPEDTATPPEDTATPPEDTATPPEDALPSDCETICNGLLGAGCEAGPQDEAACLTLCTDEEASQCGGPWITMKNCVMAEMGMVTWTCGADGSFAIQGDCGVEFDAWHACVNPPANPCEPNPCQNAGNCKVDAEGAVECYCVEPFTGEFCETCGTACEDKECGFDPCGDSCGTCEEGWMCNDMGMCEEPANPKKALCIETGGDWDPTSCGDWTCGEEPLCKALKPGCNCGEGKSFDAEAGCFEDDSCGGDACNPNPCDVGKNCKLLPDGTHECFVAVPDWCEAICTGMQAGCPAAMEGTLEECADACAENFLDKCQPKHMDFANCFPGDGAWVCDAMLGIAPANDQCSAEWAAIAECEEGEAPAGVCPDGMENLGEFAIWCGKVNVHNDPDTGMWMKDDDCKSGCNDKDVAYCQKYWPGAMQSVEINVTPVPKPFHNAGCQVEYLNPGKKQFACCGPPMMP